MDRRSHDFDSVLFELSKERSQRDTHVQFCHSFFLEVEEFLVVVERRKESKMRVKERVI